MNSLRCSVVIVAFFCLVALATPSAHADSVTYTFNGINSGPFGDGLRVALQFTAPTFITSLTPVSADQLNICTDCLVSTKTPAAEFRPDDTIGDAIGFVDYHSVEYFYRFPTGAFSTPGFYTTLSQSFPGTLIVSTFPDVSTPENGTLALLASGLLGLLAICHRRLLLS
jgi:hypothetical protein